jgi:hypothetical protein
MLILGRVATVRLEMGPFYTLEITVQRTDAEQKTKVNFPLSVGLDISQTPVAQGLRNQTSGTKPFRPPRDEAKNCGLTVLASTYSSNNETQRVCIQQIKYEECVV